MVEIGTTIDSPQTGERLTFLSTADSSNGELFRAELLVQAGSYVVGSHKLSPRGVIPLLQGAVLVMEVGDFIRPSAPGVFLQDLLFPPLAVLGRWRGYRARYPQYRLPAARIA